jgi:hypothetical protein
MTSGIMPVRAENQMDRINIGKIFKDLKLKTLILGKPQIGSF